MANNLKELKNQRKILKGMITRIQNSISEQDGIQELEMRLNNLTDSLQKYNDVQAQIEVLQLEDISKDEETWDVENDRERAQVENQFYKTAGQIKSLIMKNKPSSSNPSHKTNSTVINFNSSSSMDRSELIANLKPLPLPIFTGKHCEWFTFYDSYKSLVHDDNCISDIRKFHYLRGCLKDEAFRAIECLAVSGDNYASAIEVPRQYIWSW